MIKLIFLFTLLFPFLSCTANSKKMGQEEVSSRTPAEIQSCKEYLQAAVVGFEIIPEKCEGQAIYTGEGCTETIDEEGPLQADWSPSSEIDFYVMTNVKYKPFKKKKLLVKFVMTNLMDKKIWEKSFDQWEKWKSKNSNRSYMRLKGFNARDVFNPVVYEPFNEYNAAKKKTKAQRKQLPHKMIMTLVDEKKDSILCQHAMILDERMH